MKMFFVCSQIMYEKSGIVKEVLWHIFDRVALGCIDYHPKEVTWLKNQYQENMFWDVWFFLFCFFHRRTICIFNGILTGVRKAGRERHACIYRVCSHLGGINIQNISFTSEMVFVGEKRNIYIYTYIKKRSALS